MAGDATAYAVLGIGPEADSAEIERAYRRLIKQHHPDRQGGDPERAAEINRAYRELRIGRDFRDSLDIDLDSSGARRPSRIWFIVALALAIATIGLLLVPNALLPLAQRQAGPTGGKAARKLEDPMNQPLHGRAVDEAALDALRISRTRDEIALASASRDCHRLLRSNASLLQLDRCAAFDDAVVQLEDRDPLRDQGPFSEIAVTGRQWSGATELSDDSVAIDARLARIRLRVELALANDLSTPGAAKTN